jgi:hypothetical protein
MSDIVNLRRARKAKARSEAERTAEANRAKFGRPKAERELGSARHELEERRLDGHVLKAPLPATPPKHER